MAAKVKIQNDSQASFESNCLKRGKMASGYVKNCCFNEGLSKTLFCGLKTGLKLAGFFVQHVMLMS